MNRKTSDRAARLQTLRERVIAKGSKNMWYIVMADTVVEMFQRQESITLAQLAARLEELQAQHGNPLLANEYDEAARCMREVTPDFPPPLPE